MTVLTLALLAGSQPAAPRLAPVHQIGPQSRRQSPHTPCAPLVRTDALTLTWQKADRHKRSAPTSSSHTPWPNPHSACGTAAAPLPAISCLGAFRPPAARARGEVRHCRQPKTCTTVDIPILPLNIWREAKKETKKTAAGEARFHPSRRFPCSAVSEDRVVIPAISDTICPLDSPHSGRTQQRFRTECSTSNLRRLSTSGTSRMS
jgi:hypothetical protein